MESVKEALVSDPKKRYRIYGEVEPGFEPILNRYAKMFEEGAEKNSQLCIYYKDRKVVDVWGEVPGYRKNENFDGNCLMNIFSSGKSLGAICMAFLRD